MRGERERDDVGLVSRAGEVDERGAASTVSLRHHDRHGRKRLATALQRTGALLVLDNAEHVIEAVAGLVVECHTPKVRFIVTSPLTEDDGVRLFEQRATSLGSNLCRSDVERHAIREVVDRLEGVPLAIELAAARSTVLPPSEIARHIGRSLDILRGGARDAPTRHSSLHAAIEWSFRLLEPDEQRSLVACSVFHDSRSLPATCACLAMAVRTIPSVGASFAACAAG